MRGLATQARVSYGPSALLIVFEHPSPQGLEPLACGRRQGWGPRAGQAG